MSVPNGHRLRSGADISLPSPRHDTGKPMWAKALGIAPNRGTRPRFDRSDEASLMMALIYKPARTAMQSGVGKTRHWLLEFEAEKPLEVEPLMGWTSSAETRQQVQLWFETKEEAVAYAERAGIPYRVEAPKETKRRPLSYSDNFKFNRVGLWTH
jgi:hypothetical protein